jgi:tetratricopeptide (TPR) repeat protein
MRSPILAGLLAVPLAAMAVPALAAPPKKAAVAKDDPQAVAHKQFLEAIKSGSTKYTSKDVPGAIADFQKAGQLEPRNPLSYYLLGEAHLGNNDLPQAESAWLHASQVSDEGPPGLKAKIFFVIADLREREKRWDDAKAAWEQYTEVASKLAEGAGFPKVGPERIGMIDAMQKQDKAYEVVRQRIKEENDKKAKGIPIT